MAFFLGRFEIVVVFEGILFYKQEFLNLGQGALHHETNSTNV